MQTGRLVSLLGNAVDGKQNRLHVSGLIYFWVQSFTWTLGGSLCLP